MFVYFIYLKNVIFFNENFMVLSKYIIVIVFIIGNYLLGFGIYY